MVKIKKGDMVEWDAATLKNKKQVRKNKVVFVKGNTVGLSFPQRGTKAAIGTLDKKFVIKVVRRKK